MAKNTGIPMLAALFGGEVDQKGGRKNTIQEKVTKPKVKKAPQPKTSDGGGVGSDFSQPSPAERMKDHARDAKVSATRDWVEGRIDTKKHNAIHTRANRVLTNKGPKVKLKGNW